ncbi:MAG: TIGR03792 family protein [Cyanobacteriota bacterium]|nr:TIGR03792 family protein [Cyanobacteriota bacterium]
MDGQSNRLSLSDIRQGTWQVLRGLDQRKDQGVAKGGSLVAVVEHLRLKVSDRGREAWLLAELETWDPWLRQQKGFVEREVLWDSDREEGILLIHWASHADWKAIPTSEVATIQESFEAAAKRRLALPPQSENPFPLIFAGEVELA